MQRRQFIKLFWASSLGAAALGLSGCEPYDETHKYGPHDYYYYPSSNAYYHSLTGTYFHYVNGVWVRSISRPPHIILNPSNRRRVYVSDRYPYSRNREHRKAFPHNASRPSRADQDIRKRAQVSHERRQEEQRKRDRADQAQRQGEPRNRDRGTRKRHEAERRKQDQVNQERLQVEPLKRDQPSKERRQAKPHKPGQLGRKRLKKERR